MELSIPNLTGEFSGFAGTNITKIIDLGKATSIVGSGDGYHTYGAALGSCHYLTEVILPDTMTSITGMIDCTALEKVSFNNNVTIIGNSTFEGCTKLTSIGDVSNVTSIGDGAFYNCKSLTTIGDLSNVTSIDNSAFCNCTKLTTIGNLTNITSIGLNSFSGCSSLKNFDIGKIIKIPNFAFRGCTSLETIDLTNVTYIGAEAFTNCSSLKSLGDTSKIEYLGGYNVFGNCSSLAIDLNFPNLKDSNTNGADCNNSGITNIISLGSITVLSASMHSCKNLKTVILPETFQDITYSTFYDCSNLLWVKILSTTMCKLTKTDAFDYANNCILYVVDTLVDTYKADTNWSKYASRIKALSSFT